MRMRQRRNFRRPLESRMVEKMLGGRMETVSPGPEVDITVGVW